MFLGWVVLFRFSLDSFRTVEIQSLKFKKEIGGRGEISLTGLKTCGGDGIIGGQRDEIKDRSRVECHSSIAFYVTHVLDDLE